MSDPFAAAVGQRISVRRRLPEAAWPGGPTLTDVVGTLEGCGPVLAVRRRDGSLAEVPAAAVVEWRVVPPAPPRRAPRAQPS